MGRLDLQAGDCEALAAGWPAQPVNTAAALALVVAGAVVLGASRARRWLAPQLPHHFLSAYGALVVLAGLGSVAYHGWANTTARYVHDLANVVLLAAVVGGVGVTRRRWPATRAWAAPAAAGVVTAPLLLVAPGASNALVAVLAIAAVVVASLPAAAAMGGRGWSRASLAVTASGLGALVAGRSGSPLCDPASAWQWHAAWHVLAAAALLLWAAGTGRRRRRA